LFKFYILHFIDLQWR